jgi:YD repeat-containing protein
VDGDHGYDQWGQLTSVADALGYTNSSERNALGWTLSSTNANGQTITYHYDSWGRLRQKDLPDGSVVVYRYNLNGQMTEMTDATGVGSSKPGDSVELVLRTIVL